MMNGCPYRDVGCKYAATCDKRNCSGHGHRISVLEFVFYVIVVTIMLALILYPALVGR